MSHILEVILSKGRKRLSNFYRYQFPVRQGGFSLIEVLVGSAILIGGLLALSSSMTFSQRATRSIASSTDFNSLVNSIQGVLNNATTCIAALGNIPLDPGGSYPPAGTMGALTAITTGGSSPVNIVATGPQNGSALNVTRLQLSKPSLIGATGDQYMTSLSLVATKVVGGVANNGAVGSQTLSHSFQLIVSLDSGSTPPYQIKGCSGLGDSLWQKVGGVGPDIYYSAGKVGIGTGAPGALLEINGQLASSIMSLTNAATFAAGGNGLNLSIDNSLNASLNNSKAGFLSFGTSNAERMRIDSAGNVGIATTSPGSTLHVNGTVTLGKWNTVFPTQAPVYAVGSDTNGWTLAVVPSATTAVLLGQRGGAAAIGAATSAPGPLSPLTLQPGGGNVGIGTTSPILPLSIESSSTPSYMALPGWGLSVHYSNTGETMYMSENQIADTSKDLLLNKSNGGNVTVGGCVIYKGGQSGVCTSDQRIKKEVRPFSLGLKEVLGIHPIYFKYNGLGGSLDDGSDQVGVIAQQTENVAPELVGTTRKKLDPSDGEPTEIKTVNYSAFTYMLINAVKELHHEIVDHFSTLIQLKASVRKLESQNADKDQKIKNIEQENLTKTKELKLIKARLDKLETMIKSK